MMARIHPQAQISSQAEIDDDVTIGAYCVIGDHVRLHKGVQLCSHVVVEGRTIIKDDTTIYPFAVLGVVPQDLKYEGEDSRLVIGMNCTIREHATLHTGTKGGGMETLVGDHCLLMVGSHVGHDCQLGDRVIMANNATLGGHCVVEDDVFIGGLAAIHQYIHIGAHAMISGACGLRRHVLPATMVIGVPAYLKGLNLVGLRRRAVPHHEIHELRRAYKFLFKHKGEDKSFEERLVYLEKEHGAEKMVKQWIDFIAKTKEKGKAHRLGICKTHPS